MTQNSPAQNSPAQNSPVGTGVIVVVQEGRAPLHVVVVDRLEVGRECDGLLMADQRVSRRHLRLDLVDGRMVVADLGSSNGTFLDGMRIRSPVVLEPYSTVTLGTSSIRLHLPQTNMATAAAGSDLRSGPANLTAPDGTPGLPIVLDRVGTTHARRPTTPTPGPSSAPAPAASGFLTPIRH